MPVKPAPLSTATRPPSSAATRACAEARCLSALGGDQGARHDLHLGKSERQRSQSGKRVGARPERPPAEACQVWPGRGSDEADQGERTHF